MKKIGFPSLLIVAALAGCGEKSPQKPAEVRPVRAEQAGGASALAEHSYPGTVAARYESELAFRVGGRITARRVQVGDRVAAGQPLATLDGEDLALASAAVRQQLTAAEAERQLAYQEMRRAAELSAKNFVSQVELDRRRMATDAADAKVLQLLAELIRADNQRSYATLAAPHAGAVTAIAAEPGQVVAPGQMVAKVARTDAIEIEVSVPEADLAGVRAAKSFEVSVWALPDAAMRGTLRELASAADPATRTYRARVAIERPDPALRLGMTATVSLPATPAAHLTLPQSALFRVSGAPQVWVLDRKAQRVAARSVEVGALVGERVEIVSGLAPGEWVVTAGVHALTPDQTVQLAGSDKP